MVTCACGCGETVPPAPKVPETCNRYASTKCRQRYHNRKRRNYTAKWRGRKSRKRTGRVCGHCERTDRETRFGHLGTICSQCRRQARRNKCGRCGAPFYVHPRKGRELGCVANCRSLLKWMDPDE